MNKSNKKMILEILIIAVALGYLFYLLLSRDISEIATIYSILLGIISFELIIKYIRQVYIYKDKYNYLKTLFIVFNVGSLFICFMKLYKNIDILYLLILGVLLLIYLMINVIINLKKLLKEEKKLFNLVKNSLLELISCFLIIDCLIIILIN